MTFLLLLNACSFSKKVSDPEEVLYGSDWILFNLKGSNISMDAFAEGVPRIKFDPDGNIRIYTGCNTIKGKFSISGSYLNLDFASDSEMCPRVASNDFINSLKDSKRYVMMKERLMLMDGTSVLMAFFPK